MYTTRFLIGYYTSESTPTNQLRGYILPYSPHDASRAVLVLLTVDGHVVVFGQIYARLLVISTIITL